MALTSNHKVALGFGVFVVLVLVIAGLIGWNMYLTSQSHQTVAVASTPAVVPDQPAPPPPPPPVMDWKEIKNDGFVINPGTFVVSPATIPGTPPPRIEITAVSPVSVAYFPTVFRDTILNNWQSAQNFKIYRCVQHRVLHATLVCDLPPSTSGFSLWIRDERTAGSAIVGGLLGGLGFKAPAEQQMVRNDVTIKYSVYTCVDNCR
jgi:hypothetical protein